MTKTKLSKDVKPVTGVDPPDVDDLLRRALDRIVELEAQVEEYAVLPWGEGDKPLYWDMTIAERLLAVQKELNAVQAGGRSGAGNYKYRSHGAVTAAVRPLLAKYNVYMQVTTVEADTEVVTLNSKTNLLTKVQIAMSFWTAEKPVADHEHCLQNIYHGVGLDSRDLGPGKAISYAVKMGLLKQFMLDRLDDTPDLEADSNQDPWG